MTLRSALRFVLVLASIHTPMTASAASGPESAPLWYAEGQRFVAESPKSAPPYEALAASGITASPLPAPVYDIAPESPPEAPVGAAWRPSSGVLLGVAAALVILWLATRRGRPPGP